MKPNLETCGLPVRTACTVGYVWRAAAAGNSEASCNNNCLDVRDKHTFACATNGWPKNGDYCYGNDNGKNLDRCMFGCYEIEDLAVQRSLGGKPYDSEYGDKCFNEMVNRGPTWSRRNNFEEWLRCTATFM